MRHGASSGYKSHRARGEPACDDCAKWASEYNAGRSAKPDVKARQTAFSKAHAMADRGLRQLYPAVWEALRDQALKELGVTNLRPYTRRKRGNGG